MNIFTIQKKFSIILQKEVLIIEFLAVSAYFLGLLPCFQLFCAGARTAEWMIIMSKERSLKESIYDKILESILNYEFKPNQILTEKDLVQRYGCSKSPVREALISLCTDSVLRNIPRCGYEVIRLTKIGRAHV